MPQKNNKQSKKHMTQKEYSKFYEDHSYLTRQADRIVIAYVNHEDTTESVSDFNGVHFGEDQVHIDYDRGRGTVTGPADIAQISMPIEIFLDTHAAIQYWQKEMASRE